MAATCAGVACFGVAAASPQKPRALMMSAGVCGLASSVGLEAAGLDFAGWTVWTSAEASCKVAAIAGFARGIGTAWVDLAGVAEAITLAGAGFSLAAAAPAPSSSSSLDLLLNKAANRLGLVLVRAPSPSSRFSM